MGNMSVGMVFSTRDFQKHDRKAQYRDGFDKQAVLKSVSDVTNSSHIKHRSCRFPNPRLRFMVFSDLLMSGKGRKSHICTHII